MQYLTRPARIAKSIRRKRETIEELRNSLLPAGIRYDVDKVQTSPEDPILRVEARIDEIERDVQLLIVERAEALADVAQTIESLDDELVRQVTHCRFVKGMQISAISNVLYCGEATVYRCLRNAKRQINAKLIGRDRF